MAILKIENNAPFLLGGKTIFKTVEEFSWIGSLAALGSAVSCVPIAILADIIGRKYSMLILVIPFTIGWLCIIFAKSIALFYVGRFLIGFSGGAFCVTGPMYTSEIAESEIRGRLGLYYQLFLTVGIVIVNILNFSVNMFELSVISGFSPIIFAITFFFMPETPVYYLIKGNEDAARKSYIKFRGPHYDIEPELSMQKRLIEEANKQKVSFLTSLKTKACMKGLLISYGLMFIQQCSGINAIAIYSGPLFEATGSSVGPKEGTMAAGAIALTMVLISSLIVDRLGRRILLTTSIIFMCLSLLALGIYFYLLEKPSTTSLDWLPLSSVCSFIISYSFGFGPIPWMMISEIFAPEIKAIVSSSACFLHWIMAFIIAKTFVNLNNTIHTYGTKNYLHEFSTFLMEKESPPSDILEIFAENFVVTREEKGALKLGLYSVKQDFLFRHFLSCEENSTQQDEDMIEVWWGGLVDGFEIGEWIKRSMVVRYQSLDQIFCLVMMLELLLHRRKVPLDSIGRTIESSTNVDESSPTGFYFQASVEIYGVFLTANSMGQIVYIVTLYGQQLPTLGTTKAWFRFLKWSLFDRLMAKSIF
uniref:Major facilitator superfamily (MFS) profile domain-containing protein n=1 Tax=Vespula pensylvanica TaxID=30213 RepID=A0A834NR95_VESPE|nr:hypothetical protein H0235_012472 [Vespula pensylvanica]